MAGQYDIAIIQAVIRHYDMQTSISPKIYGDLQIPGPLGPKARPRGNTVELIRRPRKDFLGRFTHICSFHASN